VKGKAALVFKRFRKGTLIAILLCFLAVTTTAYGEKKDITIAILPCLDEVMTLEKFYPLIKYLKKQTGLDIKIVVPKNFDSLQSGLIKGDIDFTLQDPHTYVKLSQLFNRDILIRIFNPEGKTCENGVFLARKDSGIKNIGDLRGKTVLFGPKLSLTRWIAARELLTDNGIDLDKDLKAYFNSGCCVDIVFNVYLKEADAGVVCKHFLESDSYGKTDLGVDLQQLVVIGKTKEVPMRVFAAHKGLPDDIVNPVVQSLLELNRENPAHEKILHSAELGGFQKTNDKEYDDIRTLIGIKREREALP
jgi:phosphonate transport system substrate-binding protein